MFKANKKWKAEIDKVAQQYEQKLQEMKAQSERQKIINEKIQDGYESLIKEYDDIMEIHNGRRYMDREGNINQLEEWKRRRVLKREETKEIPPFL